MSAPTKRERAQDEEQKDLLVAMQDEMDKPRGEGLAALRGILGDAVVDRWLREYSKEDDMADDGRSIFDDEEDDNGE